MGRRSYRHRATSAGFSLTEVLVALAILIVGIFALIELFPPGFFTLQIAANDTAANRLAQAELERLGANDINQLGTISALDTQMVGGVPNFSYDPIDSADLHLRVDTSLNTSSDVDGERAIQGETVRIPPATGVVPTAGGNPAAPVLLSTYVVNFAPIQMTGTFIGNFIDPKSGQLSGTNANQLAQDNFILKVGGLPWLRIVGDSTGTLTPGNPNPNYADPNAEPANDAPQYLIDYKQMKIAVGPEFPTPSNAPAPAPKWYPQPFNFTVQGTDGDLYSAQFVWDPTNLTYYNPAVGNGAGCQWFTIANWTNLTTGGTNAPPGWQPGTDKLWRDFHIVYNAFTNGNGLDLATFLNNNGETFTTAFGADPYAYAIADVGLSTNADMGVLAFNPTAAQVKDANGNPLRASISYNTFDWHIVHEDHTLGNTNQQGPTVRLILKNIFQIGQALSDNSLYTGIVTGMNNPLDVYALDLNSGQTIAPNSIDYNNGVVTFPQTAGGDHVRIFYKATGDWGLAIIKAASAYAQKPYSTAANADPVPPDQTAPGQAAPAAGFPIPPIGMYEIESPGGQPTTRLLFPGTDIGKLVRIENVTGSNGVVYRDANVRTIQPDPVSSYAVSMNGHFVVEHLYGVVDLTYNPINPPTDPDGNLGVLPAGVNISSVGSVVGASITARVLWKERDVWKSRDMTTLAGSMQQAGG
jgi:hypothetical protein